MLDRLRAWSTTGWRVLLVAAVVAFVIAALATQAGLDSISRTAGTLGWACGLVGAVTGLVVERAP